MITVTDIAYVRYRAPDLDRMEQFLLDFGLRRSERTATKLYMRAASTESYVHITELSDAASAGIGIGLFAQSEVDLQKLADECGTEVKNNAEPRGGKIVTVRDPDGLQVDVVYGGRKLEELPVRSSFKLNVNAEQRRLGSAQRLALQPSSVLRLGHVVLKVHNFRRSFDFYTAHFGFKPADMYYDTDPAQPVVAFMRCGLGKQYTDHHTLAVGEAPSSGFDHSAFEVIDWDDVATGHHHLRGKGHVHAWGIGRHVEGSQIFDYWRDPFGNKVEHWTDGDRINDNYVVGLSKFSLEGFSQWAPPVSADFLS